MFFHFKNIENTQIYMFLDQFNPFCLHIMQPDWLRIAGRAYAGIFAVTIQLQNQDQFWISHQRNQGSFFSFFRKVKN